MSDNAIQTRAMFGDYEWRPYRSKIPGDPPPPIIMKSQNPLYVLHVVKIDNILLGLYFLNLGSEDVSLEGGISGHLFYEGSPMALEKKNFQYGNVVQSEGVLLDIYDANKDPDFNLEIDLAINFERRDPIKLIYSMPKFFQADPVLVWDDGSLAKNVRRSE